MGDKATNLLPLEDCFQRLKRINHAIKLPKDVAQLYTAALGLYCHLKKEQALLHEKAKNKEPCPVFDQTPAMTAVISDPRLFASLLRCLKVPPPELDTDGSSATHQHRRNMSHRGSNAGVGSHLRTTTPGAARILAAAGRKRGMSFSEDVVAGSSAKLAKTGAGVSPMMSKQKLIMAHPNIEASLPIQLIAASIFYASLQHLDHWPAPLLHAYAEDAFGPRLWVDRAECQLLVSNLKLVIDSKDTSSSEDVSQETLDQAEQVATYYANMMLNIPPEEPSLTKPLRMSFTSLSGNKPFSRETSLTRQGSAEEVPFPEDDSDSGEEEIVEVSMGTVKPSAPSGGKGGDDSSSSGEEEVVMTAAASFDQGNSSDEPAPNNVYPVTPPKEINLQRIRQRFVGANAELGFAGIAAALSGRLEMKSKQNSRLLQTLPYFCTVPGVRALIAKSLGKWLQSPALSGAARTLFASTVQHLKECDPPLPEDLEAIDAILSMQLKANQLNMHIENVTNVAKRIPTAAVSRHIFLKLLRKEVTSMDNASQSSEHLQMVCAVHAALSKTLRNDGIAASILTLLAEPSSTEETPSRRERNQLVRKIRLLLRRLFGSLGASYFDGCGLVESLLSFDFKPQDWSVLDEEDKGRIILECIALHVPSAAEEGGSMRGKGKKFVKTVETANGLSYEEVAKLEKMLLVARKLMITWCVMDYAPLWQAANNMSSSSSHRDKSPFNEMMQKQKEEEDIVGAEAPDFSSILDDESSLSKHSTCPDAMKCVLFMVDPESPQMQRFLYPEGPPPQGDSAAVEEMHRIRQCYQYGADLDDKMLSIILASTAEPERGVNAPLALSLIEHLFECCKTGRNAELRVADANIVWDMYKLVEHIPETIPTLPKVERVTIEDPNDQFADAEDEDGMEVDKPSNGSSTNGDGAPPFPRLALPGSWWRVTALALIMTGASPAGIGSKLSDEHPTLRELIKMVTSGRYRFPTVDWDDLQREDMKKSESDMRHQESTAAELLFLPPLPDKLKALNADKSAPPHGARVSVRQRQRHERILREKQEKEVAEALALANKRKKMLRVAQKSIMIWDPKGPARKPPKESVNLILSVEKMFGLSETYQKCVEPDLVQAAIGDTSRGAIERAYDWLIPVISTTPSVINRLPASASCFLLLRVYGTESEGNSKLRELSAPLLEHVRKTVTGGFGQDDAIRATNLLLADVADKKPARRRCARRVLQEALAELNDKIDDKSYDSAKCTWMRSLLLVEHIEALLPDAIKYFSDALSHERGRVLRAFVLSLNDYINFAKKKGIKGTWNFSTSLCELMSTRQSVCSEAVDRFLGFRRLSIAVVHEDFKGHLGSEDDENEASQARNTVQFKPCRSYMDGKFGLSTLPLSLLQSACVLLSIWKEADISDGVSQGFVNELANILMFPFDSPEALLLEADKAEGVAGATIINSGSPAISVDEWVMLAKSRSDYIARRAALSAPAKFLPRLLLCSGLPKTSLLTMIDRLGKLGEKSESKSKVYRELLMPSATMDWGFGQIGTRREIARKLLGRLSAYVSMSGDSPEKLSEEISFTFIGWLSEECQPPEKPKKGRPLKKAIKAGLTSGTAAKLLEAESLLEKVADIEIIDGGKELLDDNTSMSGFKTLVNVSPPQIQDDKAKDFIKKCCARNDSDTLEAWINASLFSEEYQPLRRRGAAIKPHANTKKFAIAVLLLECTLASSDTNSEWHRVVERWIPLLSCSEGTPKLWKSLFSEHESELSVDCIVSACLESWCPFHSAACRDWILENAQDLKGVALQRVVSFLLQTSGQHTAHASSFQRGLVCSVAWLETKESVDSLVSLSFECAKQAGEMIDNRNDVAAWLQLLLLVAQAGKKQANHMVNTVLLKVEKAKHDGLRMLMAEAILRIYSYYPTHVSLGNPKLRTLLVDASKSIDWRTWRTPMDETLNDMLAGLKVNPSQRLVHGLVDISKSHPLILLRKLDAMADILENDASTANRGLSRVRVQAEDLEGPATAEYKGRQVRIVVRHWGYSYTDPLWVSFLDILLSVPREVLFSCGMRMGLDGLLLVYVKLLYVQSQLQNREKVVRLKTRFTDLIKAFEKDPAWNEWLASSAVGLDSLNTVRNVLIRCSLITTDQAVENIRSAQEK